MSKILDAALQNPAFAAWHSMQVAAGADPDTLLLLATGTKQESEQAAALLDGVAPIASPGVLGLYPASEPIRALVGDSATRAGTLSRGTYRGVPSSARGEIVILPGEVPYTAGNGATLSRNDAAESRADSQARAASARESRATAQARRAKHVASDGTMTPGGTYCGGYRPGRK
jgi:hypothetical protein